MKRRKSIRFQCGKIRWRLLRGITLVGVVESGGGRNFAFEPQSMGDAKAEAKQRIKILFPSLFVQSKNGPQQKEKASENGGLQDETNQS